jgi:hypothetical protein
MESPYEIKAHQRMERGKQGKVGSGKMDSLDEPQGDLIKGGRGTSFKWNVITQVVGWEKPNPTTKWRQL